jgi:hypothetical protein
MLSKKAQQLLSKESKVKRSLKFQLGGPTVNIDPTFNPLAGMDNAGYGLDNSNYQMDLNQPLHQYLTSAQNYNYTQLQNNAQRPNNIQQGQPQVPVQQPQGNWQDYTGALGKIGFGIKSLVEGQKERKNAKIYERISKEENDRRLEAQRQTGYVLTPYTNKRTWSMKKGGMYIPMPSPSYQEGGLTFNNNLDQFLDSYNNQLEQQQQSNEMFQNHYDSINNQKKLKWKDMQKQGLQTLNQSYKDIQNAVKLAVTMLQVGGTVTDISQIDPNWKSKTDAQLQFAHDSIKEQANIANQQYKTDAIDNNTFKVKSKVKIDRMKQEGGEIDSQIPIDAPDTESLYSPDFQSPVESSSFEPQETMKQGLESWIFQDDAPMPDKQLQSDYSNSFNPISSSNSSDNGDIISWIKKHESGGNPDATNMIGATGYYQFTPMWADKIAPFMGLPQGTSKDKVMEAFRKNPQAQDAFMKHVVDDIYKPEIEKLRPLANKYGFSDNEMIKLLHYRGIADTKKRLQTGDFEVSREEKEKYNNPDILKYVKSK